MNPTLISVILFLALHQYQYTNNMLVEACVSKLVSLVRPAAKAVGSAATSVADDIGRGLSKIDDARSATSIAKNGGKAGLSPLDDAKGAAASFLDQSGKLVIQNAGKAAEDALKAAITAADEVFSSADNLGAAAYFAKRVQAESSVVGGITRADDFLRNLAKGTKNLPDEILPLLDEMGEFPLDNKLQQLVGGSLSRVKTHGGDMADPVFWKSTTKYLNDMKMTRSIKALTDASVRAMREFEPKQLIDIQQAADDTARRMANILDEALQGAAVINVVVTQRRISQAAADIYVVAGEQMMIMVRRTTLSVKKIMKKPGQLIELNEVDINDIRKAEEAFRESEQQLLNAVNTGENIQTMSKRLSEMMDAGQDLLEKSKKIDGILKSVNLLGDAAVSNPRTWKEVLTNVATRKEVQLFTVGLTSAGVGGIAGAGGSEASTLMYDHWTNKDITHAENEARDTRYRAWLRTTWFKNVKDPSKVWLHYSEAGGPSKVPYAYDDPRGAWLPFLKMEKEAFEQMKIQKLVESEEENKNNETPVMMDEAKFTIIEQENNNDNTNKGTYEDLERGRG